MKSYQTLQSHADTESAMYICADASKSFSAEACEVFFEWLS